MQTNDNRSNNLKHKTLGGVARRILSGLGTACRHNVDFAPKRIMKSTGEVCLHVSMLLVGLSYLTPSKLLAKSKATTAEASIIASSESHGNYPATKAFDGDSTTFTDSNRFLPLQSKLPNVFLTWKFNSPFAVSEYKITGQNHNYGSRGPKDFKLQGSQDGTSWSDVDVQSDIRPWATNETKSFNVSQPEHYTYYKLLITAASGGDTYLGIREVELWGTGASSPIVNITNGNKSKPTATINWSGDVTDFSVEDIALTNATISNFRILGKRKHSFQIEPTSSETTVNISIDAAKLKIGGSDNAAFSYDFNYVRGVTRQEDLIAWFKFDEGSGSSTSSSIYAPGLLEGKISGNISFADNPGNLGIQQEPYAARPGGNGKAPWAGNTTIVYTGQVYDADGKIAFYENIDDKTWLKVNNQILLDDDGWNRVTSKKVDFGKGGWFDFEVRFGNGGGGAGEVGGMGFGIDETGTKETTNKADYTYPKNSSSKTYFRTSLGASLSDGAAFLQAVNLDQV